MTAFPEDDWDVAREALSKYFERAVGDVAKTHRLYGPLGLPPKTLIRVTKSDHIPRVTGELLPWNPEDKLPVSTVGQLRVTYKARGYSPRVPHVYQLHKDDVWKIVRYPILYDSEYMAGADVIDPDCSD